MDNTPPFVFLNYRWLDSAAATGRMYDHLFQLLANDKVFLDHYSIDYGDSVPKRIETGLQAQILLVVIGEKWLEILLKKEEEKENDWVVTEINTYLQLVQTDKNKRIVPVFLPEVDVRQIQGKHTLADQLLELESFPIPNHREWDTYMNILAERIREWTLPEPIEHLKTILTTRYQNDPLFTNIGFPADRDAKFTAFAMEDYFITPSYIPLDDLKKRGDWIGKEKESSSLKIRQQRQRLQNFIHQDYISLRLLDRRENLLVIGNPGVGKSTFARWLCYQWAQNVEKYEAIPVYMALREVSDHSRDGFFAHLAEKMGFNNIFWVNTILSKAAHRIQWILDGYDELSQDKQLQLHQTIHHLLKGYTPRYVLLSRPYGLLYDPGFSFDARIQLDGFSYGQIVEYVQRFLQKNKQIAKEKPLLQMLRENRVLEDYAHNPMMLSFIVSLFLTEERPVSALGTVQSQYQLQAMVYAWIRKREATKATATKLPEQLKITKEQEAFSYHMEINRMFIHEGQDGMDRFQHAAVALSNMGLGSIMALDKSDTYRFSFNSVTFQEFLAARQMHTSISPGAFGLLCRVPFFWNFSKMLVGCLEKEGQTLMVERILDDLYAQYSPSAEGQNHFKFYLFAVQLSECSKVVANKKMDTKKLHHLYQMYQMNAVYSPIWKSLLLEAIRKLYFKLDQGKTRKLKDWLLEDINPEGATQNLGEDFNIFSVQDGVKLLVQQLELWNDSYFLQGIMRIVKSVAPQLKEDENFDIYAYEPLSFMLDDVVAKCGRDVLQNLQGELLPILNALPNEFIGAATRLKGLIHNEQDNAWIVFVSETEILAADLKKHKKPGKRVQKALFTHLKAACEGLYFWGKSRSSEQTTQAETLNAIVHYFTIAGQTVQRMNMAEYDYDLEEIFQLSTESVVSFRDSEIYRAVLDFAEFAQPSYSGLVFEDTDHFFQWFERELEGAVAVGQDERLFWFVNALTLSDSLQSRFVKIRVLFCNLMRQYIRRHRAVFEQERGTFTEVQFEGRQTDVLHILRPLEKLIYFGREDSAWGEADKLALVDMALETEFYQMHYFQDNFLSGMMGTQFSLYRQSHWDFVHACCQAERLPVLFSILRNNQIFRFGANLPHLVRVARFVLANLEAEHLDERPSLVVEMAARCLRLIKTNLETPYEMDAHTLLYIVQVILLHPKVQSRFLLDETIGALEGEDALAFVTCHFLAPDDRLCFVNDYDLLFREHNRERRMFIEGLVEFFSDKDGVCFADLRSVYPHIGATMAKKLEWYIRVNEWEYRFKVEEFEGLLNQAN